MRQWITFGVVLLFLAGVAHAEDEDANGTLAVLVTAEAGGPIAHADIVVWDGEGTWTGTTDAAGRARLTGLPEGEVNVSAAADARTAAEIHDVVIEPGSETTVQLVLGPGIPFTGIVRGPDDEPIAEAYIEVEAGGTFEGYGEVFPDHAPYARTWTDEAGRFFVRGIPAERVATVVVQAEGYEEARVGVRAIGSAVRPSPLVIRMIRGGEVTGTVKTPDGKPAGGAVVYVVPEDDENLRENPRIQGFSTDGVVRAAWTARANAEGRYRVKGLPLGGTYVAAADARAYARSRWSGSWTATADAYRARRDLVLSRPGTIRVRVVVPTGRELGSVRVQCGGHLSGIDAEEVEGTWQIRRLWPGTHQLTISAAGFLETKRAVELAEGQVLDVEIPLDAGVAITGMVVDELGQGMGDVRVHAERKENDEEGWHSLTAGEDTTDEAGRFEIGGLRPGRHEITLMARGFDLLEPVLVKAPLADLRLEGVRLGRLRLRLMEPDGEPVHESVFVWRHTRKDGKYAGATGSPERPDNGVLTFEGFRGWERLTFDVDGYTRVTREIEVKPGEHVDLGDIVLDVGHTLEGRVVDADGRPVEDAVLDLDNFTEATTDALGRFELPHLPAGRIEVEVDADGFVAVFEEVVVAKEAETREDVVITLSRGTWLHGVVKDDKGEPLPEHWFQVQRQDEKGVWSQDDYFDTDDDGAFELRVKVGPCRIAYVESREKPPVILAALDGKEGESKRLDLVLKPN